MSLEALCSDPKKFNCVSCITQYGKSEKMMKKADRNRRGKGCYDYKTKTFQVDNFKLYTCVGNYVKEIDYLVEAFSQYEKGLLPFKGGLGEQPNKIIEVFNLINTVRSKHIKE